MKLNNAMRFPHPVLSPDSGDYTEGSFTCDVTVAEDARVERVQFTCATEIRAPGVAALVASGAATCGIYVTCLDTYYQQLHLLEVGSTNVAVGTGELRGTVQIWPVIVAREDCLLPREVIDQEFGASALRLRAGSVIALGEEQRFEAGLEKLQPLESVFVLQPDPEITSPRFELGTEGQAVEIHVSPELFAQLMELRNGRTRELLVTSLYLPCVVELLSVIATDGPKPELRWYQAIEARCNQLGITLDNRDLARKAQALLNEPLGSMYSVIEGIH